MLSTTKKRSLKELIQIDAQLNRQDDEQQ